MAARCGSRLQKDSVGQVVRLNRVEHDFGANGTALVHDELILGMTMQQVGERRGQSTQRWKDYPARRFQQWLDRRAVLRLCSAHPVPVKSLPR
jgi:hypothetical protein